MKTVIEPKQQITLLWSKPENRYGKAFRMMRYVVRVDHNDRVLLLNVVTGHLVVLDQDEAKVLATLPAIYNTAMEHLVDEHFLVHENYDEHQQVISLRRLFRVLDSTQREKGIFHYTILPTTACNARCYYCFEQGIKPVTMTKRTANSVVEFIASHLGEKGFVRLSFGGEPTIADDKIDLICEGLQDRGIQYQSDITTNGYLFDLEVVDRAVNLWHLTKAMVCFDGTEKHYNEAKAYVNVTCNPYQRVMRNIGLLIEKKVDVNLRMNFDLSNYLDFQDLVTEVKNRFKLSPYLQLRVHPVIGEYPDHQGRIAHASDDWFTDKVLELGDISRNAGLMSKHGTELPSLNFRGCQACDEHSVTITPEGNLIRCPELLDSDQITGDIWNGITNKELVQAWTCPADYEKCIDCVMYPFCFKLIGCATKDRCTFQKEVLCSVERTMIHLYNNSMGLQREENEK